MQTFQKFLREADSQWLPGTILMAISGSGASRKISYGVTNERLIYRINKIQQIDAEFIGEVSSDHLDISGLKTEVLLQGLRLNEMVRSSIQLDGLPNGSVIESTSIQKQFKKIDRFKWTELGSPSMTKYDSVHFDLSEKYMWVK